MTRHYNHFKTFITIAFAIVYVDGSLAQEVAAQPLVADRDTVNVAYTEDTHSFRIGQIVAPAVMIGVGVAGVSIDPMKKWNHDIQSRLTGNTRIHVDDYLQYAPAVAVYGLNLCGVKGAHNFRDRTIILSTSYLLMTASVNTLKYSTNILRPDGSSRNSFPSGHTATAFMGAEFLRMEYKDTAPWIGVAGYGIATCTGLMRIYNNRHYMSDVIAGAGIGILSTKIAYWVYPLMQRAFFGNRHSGSSISTVPYYNVAYNSFGVGCSLRF